MNREKLEKFWTNQWAESGGEISLEALEILTSPIKTKDFITNNLFRENATPRAQKYSHLNIALSIIVLILSGILFVGTIQIVYFNQGKVVSHQITLVKHTVKEKLLERKVKIFQHTIQNQEKQLKKLRTQLDRAKSS